MNTTSLPRRRPGPASKTMKVDRNKRLQSSGNKTLTRSPVINTRALSSEIQKSIPAHHSTQSNLIETDECLKIVPYPIIQVPVSRPSDSSNPSASAASNTQQKIQASCLFCSDLVPYNDLAEDEFDSQQLGKILKIVGGHLLQKYIEFPQNCSPKDVPFCATCKETILEIYEDHKIILKAQQRINNNVSKIERVVADAEILKQGSLSEKNEWTRLTDLALQGYRNKLIMKKQLRKTLALGKGSGIFSEPQFCSHTIVMKDDQICKQFKEARKNDNLRSSTLRTENNEDAKSNSSYGFGMTVEVNPMDIDPRLGPEQEHNETNITSRSDLNNEDGGLVGYYNESSCTMVISDVRSGREAADTSLSEDSEPAVKGEPWSPAPVEVQRSSNDQRKSRTRRSIFQGVDIYRISDGGSTPESLQCGICLHTVAVAMTDRGASYNAMTNHILGTHLNQGNNKTAHSTLGSTLSPTAATVAASAIHTTAFPKRRRGRPRLPYNFTCTKCSEKFPTKILLRMHNCPSPQIGIQTYGNPVDTYQEYSQINECDICGRPVKGTYMNLLCHKFSHKNDEERRAAHAAGEPGSRMSLLNRRGRRRKLAKPMIANPSNLQCQICFRQFQRRNHFANHMRYHERGQANAKAMQIKRSAIMSARSSVVNGPTSSRAVKPPSSIKEIYYCSNGNRVVIGHTIARDPESVDSEDIPDISIPVPDTQEDIQHNANDEDGFDIQELIPMDF